MNVRSLVLWLGGLVALVAIVLLVCGSSSTRPYTLHATLADADGLLKGSRVEIGGVGVGAVQSLTISPDDHALVTFTIDKADAPVGRDATLIVRPADLLGEKFLDLSVGNRADPAHSGTTLPVGATQEATDFDQIVDVLNPTVRDRLAVLIHETGVALFGRGTDLATLLRALPPSLTDAQRLIEQLSSSNAQLAGLIDHAAPVMATLSANQHQLSHFVATTADALQATATHTAGLRATIAEAPGLLDQLGTTLSALDVAGARLRPAAAGLSRTAPALTATLGALPGFTVAARPTLQEISTISPQLVGLGRRTAPVIAKLEPTMRQLQALAAAGGPHTVTRTLSDNIANLLGTLQNWARAIQTYDGAGHQFRLSAEVTPTLIKELTPFILGSAGQPARRGATHRRATRPVPPPTHLTGTLSGVVNGTTHGLASTLGQTVSGLGSAVNRVVGGLGSTLGGGDPAGAHHLTTTTTTGTTTSAHQLQGLLGYLMGGGR